MISKSSKGRGTGIQLDNPFLKNSFSREVIEGIDDWEDAAQKTEIFVERPQKILSRNSSPDIPFEWSVNPYQGCEHGCIYCYARNSHNYWGFNAGLDFESKIVIKPNAAEMLTKTFASKAWKPALVMLSGNTDCYQPLERKYKITRSLLEVFLKHRNPVGIITKNALIIRDIDILRELQKLKLVKVVFSITSLKEDLRRKLEPRTSSIAKKWQAIEILRSENIPVSILIGPVIPGLNDHEIPEILKKAGHIGVNNASYTAIRLNGQINILFEKWLNEHFPDRHQKILSQIKSLHAGNLNDSEFGRRMKGEGKYGETIKNLFEISKRKYLKTSEGYEYNFANFRRDTNPNLFHSL